MQSAVIAIVALLAHHSTAPFDMEHATTVSGTVTKFAWINPHAYIMMDAGEQHWLIEIESPNGLRNMGWKKDTLQLGDKIRCTGARAKDAAVFALKGFVVELPDGRKLQSQSQ